MQRQPLKLPVRMQMPFMYIEPNRSLAYAYVYADDLEAFTDIRSTIEADAISLKLLYTYQELEQQRCFGTMVLDFTDARIGVGEATEKLKQLPGVQSIDIENTATAIAASQNQLLQAVGTPVAVFSKELIGSTYRRLLESMGKPMEGLLFRSGEEAGRQAGAEAKALLAKLGVPLSPQFVRDRIHDLQVFGWAEIISLKADENLAGEMLLANDFETAGWHGQASAASCHWLRGFISGALSTLQGKQFEVMETECQGKGDSYCRMAFRPTGS